MDLLKDIVSELLLLFAGSQSKINASHTCLLVLPSNSSAAYWWNKRRERGTLKVSAADRSNRRHTGSSAWLQFELFYIIASIISGEAALRHPQLEGLDELKGSQSITQSSGFKDAGKCLCMLNLEKKDWPHLGSIKHGPGLVSELELLMSYLHFIIKILFPSKFAFPLVCATVTSRPHSAGIHLGSTSWRTARTGRGGSADVTNR